MSSGLHKRPRIPSVEIRAKFIYSMDLDLENHYHNGGDYYYYINRTIGTNTIA